MKRLILISAFFTVAYCSFAQSDCSKSNAIFKQDNYGSPKEVYSLGSNPEFPFIGGLSSPQQVASAMKSGKRGSAHLNNMLMDIGFAGGAKDVTASSITAYTIPAGTAGNMGDGNYSTHYVKLASSEGTSAWKVTSPSGCYLYFLAKCGNAFYPANAPAKTTACVTVPMTVASTTKDVTLESGATQTTTAATYVYYHKKHRRRALAPEYADLRDPTASTPVQLNNTKKVEAVPQTYRVTLSSADNNVEVCEDKPLEVTANINVEKTGSYAGFYPNKNNRLYKEVSKHVYKKSERKMRKAARKERKVARLTHMDVKTEVAAR